MPNRKAFLTGATGFTGGHLAGRLRNDGWSVRCLVRPQSSSNALEKLKNIGCEIVFGDLNNTQLYEHSLAGIDCLFHIAAFYRDQASEDTFWKVNFEGTKELVNAAIRANVKKYIHCSTVGVHGAIEHPPADEEAPFRPGDPYQKSKLAAEQYVLQKLQSGELSGSIFRPAAIYGPGDRRLLKLFKMAGAPLTIIPGPGTIRYHITYIDDLIEGILLVVENSQAEGQVFILAGQEYTDLNQLVKLIGKLMEKKVHLLHLPFKPVYLFSTITEYMGKLLGINPVLYRRRLDIFWKDRVFSNEKAKHILGYQPRFSLEEGLGKTLQWYQEQGWIK